MEEAARIQGIDAKLRSVLETQVFKLASDLREFENLLGQFEFARYDFKVSGSLIELFDGDEVRGLHQILVEAPAIREVILAGGPDLETLQGLLGDIEYLAGFASLAFFPPSLTQEDEPEWNSVADLVMHAFQLDQPVERQLDMLGSFEEMVASVDDPARFETAIGEVFNVSGGATDARGEFWRIPLEVSYYSWDFFYRSLVMFVLSFLLVAFTWLLPGARWLTAGAWVTSGAGTILLVAGVVVRCVLLARAPVSTLYETILFITGVAVMVSLAIEWLNRERVGLAMAAVLGALGMWLSTRYELRDAAEGDTLKSLVAVLRTNFWLSTHVTTVTMGYAAGLLAAALAHVYLIGRMMGRFADPSARKSLSRMIYGVICFGLLFSVVGTILGGIWANDSWGRFWGWDPKENGALMIVLAELFILHARLGGFIKDFGIAMLSVVNGAVVVFSWWHVNLLGVGLHSYGFTDGLRTTLLVFYGIEAALLAVAGLWWFAKRDRPSGLSGSRA